MIIGHKKNIEILVDLADMDRLAHGYIFFGLSGVGKCRVARALGYYLERGAWPDDKTDWDGHPPTLTETTIIDSGESTSIGIDAVREIKNYLWQKPIASKCRTIIIDDADRLTREAQNALLKISEEPPSSQGA